MPSECHHCRAGWPCPQIGHLSFVCSGRKQAESLAQSGKAHQAPGCRTEQGPGEGRSLQLAGEPEFSSGKAPLSSPPLTPPSLSPSAPGEKSVGCPGQAPKQAADPGLPPRLEFPDASFIFPNLNTHRPRVVHPLPADVCPQLHPACQREESSPFHEHLSCCYRLHGFPSNQPSPSIY